MDENTAPRRWGRLLTAGIAGAAALGLATAGSAAADHVRGHRERRPPSGCSAPRP